MQTVVALYSKTDAIVRPWVDAGFHAVLVDMQHPEGEHTEGDITRIGADMLDWTPPRWLAQSTVRMTFAFPPCDHLAVSGARWFAGKGLGKLAHSIRLFERAAFWCEWFGAPYLIENPVSTISSYWRKPDHVFHPHEYASYLDDPQEENTAKKTCLWVGGGFVMPAKRPTSPPHRQDCWRAAPSPERANIRSATPKGFARAVFEANHSEVTRNAREPRNVPQPGIPELDRDEDALSQPQFSGL